MKFDQQYLNLYFDLQNLEAFRRACNISTFISRYAVFLMRFDDERSRTYQRIENQTTNFNYCEEQYFGLRSIKVVRKCVSDKEVVIHFRKTSSSLYYMKCY